MDEEAWLEELDWDHCRRLLQAGRIGRLAFVSDDGPVVFPVNYRLVEAAGRTWIALRTRRGNVIDRAPLNVAFEIDGVDPAHQEGWSVLARGTLQRVDPEAAGFRDRFDPHPWILEDRDSWLIVEPFAITGRRLHAAEPEWPFGIDAYL